MTKYFCDICNDEIFCKHEFKLYISEGTNLTVDICNCCREEVENQRILADVNTYKRLRKKEV